MANRFDPALVGRSVRALRLAAKLTQAELAERADLAFETISRIESGREPPSLRTTLQLAQALDVSVDTVVGWQPIPSDRTRSTTTPDPTIRRLHEAVDRLLPRDAKLVLPVVRALARRGGSGR